MLELGSCNDQVSFMQLSVESISHESPGKSPGLVVLAVDDATDFDRGRNLVQVNNGSQRPQLACFELGGLESPSLRAISSAG
jgi:hypothetical protein